MPSHVFEESASRRAGWRLIRALLRDVRPELMRGVAAGVSWQAAAALAPLAVAQIVDDGLIGGDLRAVGVWSAVLVLLAGAEAYASRTRHKNAVTLFARTGATVRNRLLDRVQHLDAAFHDQVSPGSLLARATSDAEHMARLVDHIPHSIGFLASIFVITALLATVDLVVAAVVVGSMGLLVVVVTLGARPQRDRAAALQESIAHATVGAEETLAGFAVIKGLGAERAQGARIEAAAADVQVKGLAANRLDAVLDSLLQVLPALSLAAALAVGGRRTIDGRMTLGELLAALTYVGLLVWPMRVVGERVGTVQKGLASAQRLAAVYDAVRTVQDPAEPDALPPAAGALAIELHRVRFGFRGGPAVIDDVSIHVPAGARVAIVGSTASGKSTLLQLIGREYDADAGRVSLGGIDVRELALTDVRRRVALVGHDPVLFAGTVAENIAFARPTAGRREVERAARVAAAEGFITRLPQGYDTMLGERGMTLSGGQRQRIAIARALLAAPAVLLLDDATSALDAETEAAVIAAMTAEQRDATIVVVTHRPATLALADSVLLLVAGRVVGQGRHADLLATHAGYREVLAHAHVEHDLLDAVHDPIEDVPDAATTSAVPT
ncbi:MAG TPA: ABC transporter ATP-binding protein [Mycobacteriales bacterium]|nr:ABC transporter ATP-binding protein [Mycobacteriales bacterium]